MKQNPDFCEMCGSPIYFSGSTYVSESNEYVCLDCITIQRGNRDDFSYVSTMEPVRNSEGVIQ